MCLMAVFWRVSYREHVQNKPTNIRFLFAYNTFRHIMSYQSETRIQIYSSPCLVKCIWRIMCCLYTFNFLNVAINGIYKTCDIVFIYYFMYMCTNIFILHKRCEWVVQTVLFVNDILYGGYFIRRRNRLAFRSTWVQFWFLWNSCY